MVPEIATEQQPEQARRFLEIITDGWQDLDEPAALELRCLFPNKTPNVMRFAPDAAGVEMAVEHAQAMNAAGLNIYPVINPVRASAPLRRDGRATGASDADILGAFFFWADGDDEAAVHAISHFAGPKYTFAVTTGRTPFPRPHIYWRIEDGPIANLEEWTRIQCGIAAQLSTDKTVVNPSRIMRLPGMINWPTDQKAAKGRVPELATLRTEYDEDRDPVPFERMRRVFGAGAPAQTATGGGFGIDTGPQPLDRERARIQALSGQEWHNAVVRLVASYVAKGLSDAEIHGLTDPLTLPGYTPDQTRREVQTAIDGARRKGWTPQEYADPAALQPGPAEAPAPHAPQAFNPSPRPLDLEWFDDVEPALADSYLVKGFLAQQAMSVVYGPSNSGKTFFALDVAYSIAIGARWRGRRVEQAAVLYLAAEGGRGVANRIAALRAAHGVCDVPFALKRAGMDLLHDQADLQHIYDLTQAVQARWPGLPLLIVIDTLSRVMAGGDENSAADMTALIRNIDAIREATGAHVMLVHHTGKDTARGARGHSSLRAATDTEIEVGQVGEDGEEHRAAMVTKQRDYQGGETFAFALKSVSLGHDQDGDEVTSCIVTEGDADEYRAAKKAKKGLGGNQKLIADTFDQMLADGLGKPNGGGVGMPEPGQFWTVSLDDLRAISRGKMVASDTRSAFNQAFRALTQDRGVFVTGGNVVWRVDRRVKK